MNLSRRALVVGSFASALVAVARGAHARERPLVEVRPLGATIADADVQAVVTAVRAFFDVDVTVQSSVPLPQQAFYAPRQRYRGERLLDFLGTQVSPSARVALGLTVVDISTTKGNVYDWGVMGIANIDGRQAVLSSFRCRRGARNPAHARERFAKTAVHELGHSFGLDHCPTRGCLMHDGEGKVVTIDGENDFCADSRARLARAGMLREGAITPFAK